MSVGGRGRDADGGAERLLRNGDRRRALELERVLARAHHRRSTARDGIVDEALQSLLMPALPHSRNEQIARDDFARVLLHAAHAHRRIAIDDDAVRGATELQCDRRERYAGVHVSLHAHVVGSSLSLIVEPLTIVPPAGGSCFDTVPVPSSTGSKPIAVSLFTAARAPSPRGSGLGTLGPT